MKKTVIAAIAAVLLAVFIAACGGGGGDGYEIMFNAGDGVFDNGLGIIRRMTDSRGRITPPENVELADSVFMEWNTERAGTGETLTSSTKHTADTTYFAIWEQDLFDITETWPIGAPDTTTSQYNQWVIEGAMITAIEAAETGSMLRLSFDATSTTNGTDRSSWGIGHIGTIYDNGDENLIGLRAASGAGLIYTISLETLWLTDLLDGKGLDGETFPEVDKLTIYAHAANGDMLTKIELLEPQEGKERTPRPRPNRPPLPPNYLTLREGNGNFFAELEITYGASGDFTIGKGDIDGESLQRVFDLVAYLAENPHKSGIFRVWVYTERAGIAHWGVAQINGVQMIMGTDAFTHSYTDIGIEDIIELLEDASRLVLNPYNDHAITLVELWLGETMTVKLDGDDLPGSVVNGRSGSVTFIEDEDNEGKFTGYSFTGTSGHRGKFAWFSVNFGSKKLYDFGQVKFQYKADGSQTRRLALLARTTPFPNASLGNHQTINDSGNGYLAAYQVTYPMTSSLSIGSQANWQDITLDIDPIFAAANSAGEEFTGVIYFSIYEHTAAPTTFSIKDIEFLAHDVEQNNADIGDAKTAIEGATFAYVRQPDVTTIAQARTAAAAEIAKLDLKGVIPTIVDGTFTAAGAPGGIDGSYKFTVKLNKGLGTEVTTAEQTIVIKAMPSGWTAPTGFTVNVGGTDTANLTITANVGTVVYIDDTFAGINTGITGYQFTKDSGHRASYATFSIDIGTDSLSDFESISFDYEGTSTRTNIALIASGTSLPSTLGTHPTGGSGLATFGSDNGYVALGQVSKAERGTDVLSGEVTLDLVFQAEDYNNVSLGELTGTVVFSIYEHIGSGAVSRISNIRLNK